MNAPFSWPNSSLSISVGGIAPQSTHDERPARARARLVDRLGEQALAGAGLALEQDGRVGVGEPRQHREDPAHRVAGAERAAPPRSADSCVAVLAAERVEAQPAAADRDHRAGREVRALDRDAVDRGAVRAAEVADQVAARRRRDREVVARHRGIGEHELVAGAVPIASSAPPPSIASVAVGAVDHGEPVARKPDLARVRDRGRVVDAIAAVRSLMAYCLTAAVAVEVARAIRCTLSVGDALPAVPTPATAER